MREMDDIPRDSNNRQTNILIDDDEIDNNKNEENLSNNIIIFKIKKIKKNKIIIYIRCFSKILYLL